jgi:hypothetical protein
MLISVLPRTPTGNITAQNHKYKSFGTFQALRLSLFVGRRVTPKHRGRRAEVVVAVRLVAGDDFCWRGSDEVGERVRDTQLDGRVVVDHGGLFGSVVCAQPEPYTSQRVSDLGRPFTPGPLPDSSKLPRRRRNLHCPATCRNSRTTLLLSHSAPPGIFIIFSGARLDGDLADEFLDPFTRGALQSLKKIYLIFFFFLPGAPAPRSPLRISATDDLVESK